MEIFPIFGVMKKGYKSKNEVKNNQYKYDEIRRYFCNFIYDYQGQYGENWVTENWDDLHDYVFNTGDSYIKASHRHALGRRKAAKWLGDHDTYCVNIIKLYEQEKLSEITTDFSDPVRVVNAYTSIIGEKIVAEWKEDNPDYEPAHIY